MTSFEQSCQDLFSSSQYLEGQLAPGKRPWLFGSISAAQVHGCQADRAQRSKIASCCIQDKLAATLGIPVSLKEDARLHAVQIRWTPLRPVHTLLVPGTKS